MGCFWEWRRFWLEMEDDSSDVRRSDDEGDERAGRASLEKALRLDIVAVMVDDTDKRMQCLWCCDSAIQGTSLYL